MSELVDFQHTLFNAFANAGGRKAQKESVIWAVDEGMKRFNRKSARWWSLIARKDQQCVRGCQIIASDTYYHYITGKGWGHQLKICATCMAMILYFADVQQLPRHLFTHWDKEREQPVHT